MQFRIELLKWGSKKKDICSEKKYIILLNSFC